MADANKPVRNEHFEIEDGGVYCDPEKVMFGNAGMDIPGDIVVHIPEELEQHTSLNENGMILTISSTENLHLEFNDGDYWLTPQ